MNKEYKYEHLYATMRKYKESIKRVAELLDVSSQTVSSKLAGEHEWTISEIEFLCNHYHEDYYKLFVREW